MARDWRPGQHAHAADAARAGCLVRASPRLILALALGASSALLVLAPRISRSWPHRIAVHGHSMEPTLRAGDWLLVDPAAFRRRTPRRGEVVVARDPRAPHRLLVKRVLETLHDGALLLAGDHPAHAAEADAIGPVPPDLVIGAAWWRYWPPHRQGRPRGMRE